jgi:undecaprenyl-diphosphatase
LIGLLAAHPRAALAIVFAAAFLESLALVGSVIPGSTIVFASGILAGLHVLDPWYAGAFAVAGAIAGDAASYELGRHRRDAMLSMWPLSKNPALVARGQAYFERGGAKAVMLGRFLGPLRAIVPLVAGMACMPPAHFYAVNVLSALGWAAVHLAPGILFGASLELAGAISSRLVVLVAILVVGLWLVTRVVKLALRWGWPYAARIRDRVERYAANARHPWARPLAALLDSRRHEPAALLVSAVLLVGGAWLFLGVVEDVVTKDTLVDVDRAIYGSLQSVRTRLGDDVMVTITELGSAVVMIAVVGVIGVWFAITRRYRTLAYWLSAALFAQALVFGLKYALGRARPVSALDVEGFSFPSGHAAQSLVVFGFLAFLLGHGKSASQKTVFAGCAVAIALLVAFSRIYLGAHWFSDVVASFGLATAWIALLAIGYIQHVREPLLRAAPVLAILFGTLALVGGTYVARHHAQDLRVYAKAMPRPQLTLDDWLARGYAALPAARTEIAGKKEEPFTLQLAASREGLVHALEAAGWSPPPRWKSSALLLWLLPSAQIAQLPVVPKLDEGEPPALTFIRADGAQERLVMRLWNAAGVSMPAESSAGAPSVEAERSAAHVYVAMITRERARTEWALVSVTRTVMPDVSPALALDHALPRWRTEMRSRNGIGTIMLAWQVPQSAQ